LKGYTGLIMLGGHGGFQAFMRAPAKFAYKVRWRLILANLLWREGSAWSCALLHSPALHFPGGPKSKRQGRNVYEWSCVAARELHLAFF